MQEVAAVPDTVRNAAGRRTTAGETGSEHRAAKRFACERYGPVEAAYGGSSSASDFSSSICARACSQYSSARPSERRLFHKASL